MVPGPVRMQGGPRHHLADPAVSGGRSVSYLGYSWISPAGGTGLSISYPVVLIMQGRGQAVQGIRLSPSCTAALGHAGSGQGTRRAQRGSPAQGWWARTAVRQ